MDPTLCDEALQRMGHPGILDEWTENGSRVARMPTLARKVRGRRWGTRRQQKRRFPSGMTNEGIYT